MRRARVTPVVLALAVGALVAVGCQPPDAPSGRMDESALSIAADPPGQRIPTRYEGDRFFARPVTAAGDTLQFFTDTGGGLFIYASAVDSLGLAPDSNGFVSLPRFAAGASIPPPLGSPEGKIFVFDGEPRLDARHGMLGQAWFADRVWRFDYPGRALVLLDEGPTEADAVHTAVLSFRTDSSGAREAHFPRIRVEVAGDSLDLLFDTGATAVLTPQSKDHLQTADSIVATSFITTEVVERWIDRHPDWTVVADADQTVGGMRMIEVPRLSVGGHTVGPVWFTERPDANFHEYMARFMDRPVDGALGGSALKYFRVVVDYPNAVAIFERDG
jgi:hypothetical protein